MTDLGLTCQDCNRAFTTVRGLASHRQMKHSPGAKHSTVVRQIERERAATIPEEIRKPYQCSECDLRFTTESDLANHLKGVHCIRPKLIFRVNPTLKEFAARHGWRCHWCGGQVRQDVDNRHPLGPTREHLVPASQGGGRSVTNLVLAHKECNHRRGTIAPEAFRRIMAGQAVTAIEMWPPFNALLKPKTAL